MRYHTMRAILGKRNLVSFAFILIVCHFSSAQQTSVKPETDKIYKSIDAYSKQSRFNDVMCGMLFRDYVDSIPVEPSSAKKNDEGISQSYKAFEGKIIRQINIQTLDPFGYSAVDSSLVPSNISSKFGNSLHLKSQNITIRNLLLIRRNQVFDSLLVRESERLVRSSDYVSDVTFYIRMSGVNSDSVDIFIREIDKWSIIPEVSVSVARLRFTLSDNNLFGMGHELRNVMILNNSTGKYGFNYSYYIPNFKNTYISTTIKYGYDGFGGFTKGIALERPFFSSYARWAGGISCMQQVRGESVVAPGSEMMQLWFRVNVNDYWAGYSSRLFKGRSEHDRTTNLITAARFYRINYIESPEEMYGSEEVFSDENLYLASLKVSRRNYIHDRYLFKYGIKEDVPSGLLFGFTGGVQDKNSDTRMYLAAQSAYGSYFSLGYLSSNFEYGTYFKQSKAEQGVLSLKLSYFTKVMALGNYKFRQFAQTQAMIGFNRYPLDSLTLSGGSGMEEFNSLELRGVKRLLLKFQLQSYTPWNLWGFRFGPYLTYSCGMLGDSVNQFKNSKLYSQFGLGVLINNEHLVMRNFQISLSFYPSVPSVGQDVFKFNSFRSTDFGISDFNVGKPSVVYYH